MRLLVVFDPRLDHRGQGARPRRSARRRTQGIHDPRVGCGILHRGAHEARSEARAEGGAVADEDTVRRVTDWVLFTTWHVRKYGARFFRINQQREWNARIQLPPEEEVDASTLTAMGWWGRGFGPIGREYTFGLIADTTIDLPPGSYQFALAADDGGAVTLDGRKIIDIWPDSDRRSKADALVALSAGPHDLRVEYVQWGDMSRLRFRITPLAPNLPP